MMATCKLPLSAAALCFSLSAAQTQPSLDWAGCPALANADFRKVDVGGLPFAQVVKFAIAKDGRIIGVGQGGGVGEFNPATKTGKTLGQISGLVGGEWGLIGLALDPDFTSNGRIFVHCYRVIDAKT